MVVDRISHPAELDALRSTWDALYAADRTATIFVSFPWLRSYSSVTDTTFFVLAFRPHASDSYAALLPLSTRIVWRRGFIVERELRLGGSPLADYPGMLCLSGEEEAALDAFSRYLKDRLDWDTFALYDVRDWRCLELVKSFARGAFDVEPGGGITCPFIELPSTWEVYLERLKGSARRDLRRHMRKVEELPNLRSVDVEASNLNSQIQAVISLNQSRWGGADRAKTFERIYRGCFAAGSLWIRTLWDGDVAIAAISGFIDRARSTFYSYSSGFNEKYAAISPGHVLMAQSIQYSLENGLLTYDFLRGAERYKYALGAKDNFSQHWTVRRRTFRRTLISKARKVWRSVRRLEVGNS